MSKHCVTSIEQLEALYGVPSQGAIAKEIDRINAGYRKLIEASPFIALATSGPEGLDCSPKGDAPGFVAILDDKTLAIPDRPGNHRLDGLRNVLRDPRVAILFLIPGAGETLRVNGRAEISIEPGLLERFEVNGKLPPSVLIVHIESIYFHCAKAIMRSKLWEESSKIDRKGLPSAGALRSELMGGNMDIDAYDREQPARLNATLY